MIEFVPVDSLIRPRYVPTEPFPAYSYVTGRFAHPNRDPAGHSFGVDHQVPVAPDLRAWSDCRPYLRGLDLFNHGYYWEAHEVWEGLWKACEMTGPAADFFKGLIKLAAAGVKIREGRREGVRTHAQRAAELFRSIANRANMSGGTYFGFDLKALAEVADRIGQGELVSAPTQPGPVDIVFEFVLNPDG